MSENSRDSVYNLDYDKFVKMVFSNPKKGCEYSKIVVRPIMLKGRNMMQLESFKDHKAYHKNLESKQLISHLKEEIEMLFKNIDVFYIDKTVSSKESKKGKVTITTRVSENKRIVSHNKEKNYILKEGLEIEPLVDLGIFSKDYRLIKSKTDKYKQINRFIEIIGDEIKNFNKDEITVLDFGCGKSYLTFILYFYLTKILNIKANIVGYDLKKDVVENCNKIADKFGYENLEFVVGDVACAHMYHKKIDMVVTLHACDTATDYALCNAVSNNVKYIFSVPCCQHEINAGINIASPYSILTEHGLIKERFSALTTDAIRCEILRTMGYKVDVIEFVDFEHSPKNLMIRGKKTKEATPLNENEKLDLFLKGLGTSQKLYELLK